MEGNKKELGRPSVQSSDIKISNNYECSTSKKGPLKEKRPEIQQA